jgi:hypothetical protein
MGGLAGRLPGLWLLLLIWSVLTGGRKVLYRRID